jgi:translation initiation factor 1
VGGNEYPFTGEGIPPSVGDALNNFLRHGTSRLLSLTEKVYEYDTALSRNFCDFPRILLLRAISVYECHSFEGRFDRVPSTGDQKGGMFLNSGMGYSTEHGRMCPACGNLESECRCAAKTDPGAPAGGVRVRREIKGRGGKTVTAVYGLSLNRNALEAMASEIKRKLGTGGTVKDGVILIQGDRCGDVVEWLKQKGHRAKRTGG